MAMAGPAMPNISYHKAVNFLSLFGEFSGKNAETLRKNAETLGKDRRQRLNTDVSGDTEEDLTPQPPSLIGKGEYSPPLGRG